MDSIILMWIQAVFGSAALDAALPVVTALGNAGAVWIALGVALAITRKYRFWGITLLVALALVGVLNELLLKSLIARERPFIADPTIQLLVTAPSGYSFPSGHAGTSFAAATVIAFMPIQTKWKVGVWILAILIAFSRMYLFVHYPSDIVAGALLGTLYGIVVVQVAMRMRQRRQSTHPGDGVEACSLHDDSSFGRALGSDAHTSRKG